MTQQISESQENKEATEKKGLDLVMEHLARLHQLKDPIHREYEVIQAAKLCNLPLGIFRQMFNDYSRQKFESELLGRWRSQFVKLVTLVTWMSSLSGLSLMIAALTFVYEFPQRQHQNRLEQERNDYQAWNIINGAKGKPASSGRIDALQDLVKDKVSLAAVDLGGANLTEIKLMNANLSQANMNHAILFHADLSGTTIHKAKLEGANLAQANLASTLKKGNVDLTYADLRHAALTSAHLEDANLANADLAGADLCGTDLSQAQLTGANLTNIVYDENTKFPPGKLKEIEQKKIGYKLSKGANLKKADLRNVSLDGVDLRGANLSEAKLIGASLEGVNLTGADLKGANLMGINDWTVEQIVSAKNWKEACYDRQTVSELIENAPSSSVPSAQKELLKNKLGKCQL